MQENHYSIRTQWRGGQEKNVHFVANDVYESSVVKATLTRATTQSLIAQFDIGIKNVDFIHAIDDGTYSIRDEVGDLIRSSCVCVSSS